MKRLITLLLILYVALSLVFIGCSSTQKEGIDSIVPDKSIEKEDSQETSEEALYFNETGFPIAKEPITISVLYPRHPYHGDFNDMWFIKEIEKKTNIRLEFNLVEATGFEERKNLSFASGDYPDIFLDRISKVDDMMYGPQGILVDLSDLISKYSPELQGIFEKYPEYERLVTAPDGSIYSIPAVNDIERDMLAVRPFINKKWINNVGLELPTNLDELYTVLKAFKYDDPNENGKDDTIPFSTIYTPDKGAEMLVIS